MEGRTRCGGVRGVAGAGALAAATIAETRVAQLERGVGGGRGGGVVCSWCGGSESQQAGEKAESVHSVLWMDE